MNAILIYKKNRWSQSVRPLPLPIKSQPAWANISTPWLHLRSTDIKKWVSPPPPPPNSIDTKNQKLNLIWNAWVVRLCCAIALCAITLSGQIRCFTFSRHHCHQPSRSDYDQNYCSCQYYLGHCSHDRYRFSVLSPSTLGYHFQKLF